MQTWSEGREQVDRDLVEQARRGDREAFAILARTRADRLYAVAERILRDFGLAQDAVQQTLVAAWRELPRLRNPERFDVWLIRTLLNTCYDEARRRRVWTANVRSLPLEGPATPDSTLTIADRDQLERGFRRLPTDQRAVLVLRYYLGLSPAEIAETFDLSPGTVRSRLHYAHRAMRAVLEADSRSAVAGGRGS
jgi:RNA polymerase sigma-70 factor (ECF subfamily)